jgi:hypothetical protein
MKKYLRLFFLLFLIVFHIQGQTIYSQNFGAGTTFPAGWSSNSVGNQLVNDNGSVNSSGYTFPATPGPTVAASGNANIIMRDCNATNNPLVTLTFNGISTIGHSNLILYFGRRETSSFGNAVKLEASTDGGGSFSTISNDVRETPTASSATWTPTNYALPASMTNVSNLIFRFSYTPVATTTNCSNSSGNFRIDDFYLGKNGVLPVKLLRFEGETLSNSIELTWETSEEINVNRFEIERSTDAREFYKINVVEAKNKANIYTFSDKTAHEGVNYYRLKMIDNDGSYEYSKIISAQFGQDAQLFSLTENPVRNDRIGIYCQNYDVENLRLTSSTGQNIPFEISGEFSFFRINPKTNIQTGLYLLSIADKKGTKTLRVLVE